MDRRSRKDLLEFLDYLAEKGLMARNTIAARKAAVSKVLGILSPEEAADVTQLDLDEVMARFNNLQGQQYTPESLKSYLSRLRAAVDDFRAYQENPLGFRPNVQARSNRKTENKKENSQQKKVDQFYDAERHTMKAPLSNSIFPIPIRPDLTVYVQGIPYDLTEAEANKIANVIRAMGIPE